METRNIPAAGEFYRHFKGNLYQIIGVAKHSETLEEMVVYQALYGDYGLYTRPLAMFMSPVDKEKYPEAAQEYRFEQVVPEKSVKTYNRKTEPKENLKCEDSPTRAVKVEEAKVVTDDENEDTVREEILRFLDAEGAEAKLKVLRELRMDLDESLLTTIELSLDMLPDDKESLERRYDFVERTLEQRIRFEGGRLR